MDKRHHNIYWTVVVRVGHNQRSSWLASDVVNGTPLGSLSFVPMLPKGLNGPSSDVNSLLLLIMLVVLPNSKRMIAMSGLRSSVRVGSVCRTVVRPTVHPLWNKNRKKKAE